MTILDPTINPLDPGHIAAHEEIATLLGSIDDTTWRATGWRQGLFAARPLAALAQGLFYFATDVPALYYSDGVTWHEQHLASAANTWTGINNFEDDVFFKSGRPWIDIMADDYGAVGDNVVDDAPAIQAAVNAAPTNGAIIYIPIANAAFKCAAAITTTGKAGLTFMGASMIQSLVLFSGATKGFVHENGALFNSKLRFENMSIRGTSSSLALLSVTFSSFVTLENVHILRSGTSAVTMSSAFNVSFRQCEITSFTTAGVSLTLCNQWRFDDCNFNFDTTLGITHAAGRGMLEATDSGWGYVNAAFEGQSNAQHGIILNNTACIEIAECFIETLLGSCVRGQGVASQRVEIHHNHFDAADPIFCDFATINLAHQAISIHSNRAPSAAGGAAMMSFGAATVSWEQCDNSISTGGPINLGQPDVAWARQSDGRWLGTLTLSGAVSADGNVTARLGSAAAVIIGNSGPAAQAGIRIGGDIDLYRVSAGRLQIDTDDEIDMTLGYTRIRRVATASLPAAGASMDGRILIEDAGADQNLILYNNGVRCRVDGVAI